jgi:hypothetical protein
MGGLASEGSSQQAYTAWAGANYMGRLGQYKQDRGQGHRHIINGGTGSLATISSNVALAGMTTFQTNSSGQVLDPTTDGTNGTPRTGLTTYGPRVGKYKIIKVI